MDKENIDGRTGSRMRENLRMGRCMVEGLMVMGMEMCIKESL